VCSSDLTVTRLPANTQICSFDVTSTGKPLEIRISLEASSSAPFYDSVIVRRNGDLVTEPMIIPFRYYNGSQNIEPMTWVDFPSPGAISYSISSPGYEAVFGEPNTFSCTFFAVEFAGTVQTAPAH
jgi:hypothetical protein